jgi:RHS repeat-associated protein
MMLAARKRVETAVLQRPDSCTGWRGPITALISALFRASISAQRTETNSSFGGLYKYAGYEADASTGLDYTPGRFYDPNVGRWIEQDPLGFGAGDSNLYRYCSNKATRLTDPSGLKPTYQNAPDNNLWLEEPGKMGQKPGVNGTFSWKLERQKQVSVRPTGVLD